MREARSRLALNLSARSCRATEIVPFLLLQLWICNLQVFLGVLQGGFIDWVIFSDARGNSIADRYCKYSRII